MTIGTASAQPSQQQTQQDSSRPRGLSVESALLIISEQPGDRDLSSAALQVSRADPELLVELGITNRVMPALCRLLGALPDCPPELLARAQSIARAWTFQAFCLARELTVIQKAMDDASIATLQYKGPALASFYYGDVSARHAKDLDILVHGEDLARARQIILDLGYRLEEQDAALKDGVRPKDECHYAFFHPKKPVQVELHWSIVDSHNLGNFDSDWLWSRPQSLELLGTTVEIPNAEVLFLALCIHGGEKHQWSRLKWIADLVRMIDKRDLDWAELRRLSRECRRWDTVRQGLALAWFLGGADLPQQIQDEIRSSESTCASAAIARGRLFRGEHPGHPGFQEWQAYVEEHAERFGAGEGLVASRQSYPRYLKTVATPGWSERRVLPLWRPLRFLHYGFRVLRLFFRHRLALFRKTR